MAEALRCWRCGEGLEKLSLPLSRQDECPQCAVHLHVCRMCKLYDPAITRSCREDDAEEVLEKQRANFCDYFQPSPDAFDQDLASADRQARDDLVSLFGGDTKEQDSAAQAEDPDHKAADDLFK